jgi:hypothetical protein
MDYEADNNHEFELQLDIPASIIKVANAPQQSSSSSTSFSFASSDSSPTSSTSASSITTTNMMNDNYRSNKESPSITNSSVDNENEAAATRGRLQPPHVPTSVVDENLIGRQISNTFQGYGRKLFHGKITSYDDNGKTYHVKYEDGYEQDYSRPDINNYLVGILSEIVPKVVQRKRH